MSREYLCLDIESTGVDAKKDRIVTFFAGVLTDREWGDRIELLVSPQVEIPPEATAVHGITNEKARRFGLKPTEALPKIREFLSTFRDLPFVVMNARYDLTMLNAELTRWKLKPIPIDRIYVIDPLVVDRGRDRYRKGARKLVNLAEYYGVPFEEEKAHDAAYDCWLAGQVADAQVARWGLPTMRQQANWHREWAEHFEEYLNEQRAMNGEEAVVIGKGWPVE